MNAFISLQHPEFGYYRKGFCSIINQIIDIAHVHYKNYNNFNIKIADQQAENLFDLYKIEQNQFYDSSKLWLNLFFNNKLPYIFNAHLEANKEFLLERNFIYNNIFKIKDPILAEFLKKKDDLVNNKTLAVQIRGTDKITELPPIEDIKILKKIEQYLIKNTISDVLLCTDDIKYITLLQNAFGKLIKYNKNNDISKDGNPLHFSGDRIKLNKQVLSDLALTLGIKNFETMELRN